MAKTNFQLIRLVLDELHAQVMKEHDKKTKEIITQQFFYLTEIYKKLNKKGTSKVDYSNPVTRFAYVYKYVASNADYLYQMLRSDPNTNKLFEKEKLLVSCIGGGPGSD